ncbi:MAG: hypothetical protein BWX80_02489 [Candidatus Hydrogenedentes bacterium ADurb.Bin101]|nr:MAG: hypothetical protein BWX80_02489 [Candidatus Hydrogenedentes bacterium ADurb.Bin101]
MKRFLFLSIALALTAGAYADEAKTVGRIELFNGKNLDGWKTFLPDEKADPEETWSVKDGVIHCSGDPVGYLRTTRGYENYTLYFEWRFPGKGGNSGVLLHGSEPDQVWPKSIEGQLESGNAADLWVIGGADFAEHTNPDDRRVPRREASNEKPLGEWNACKVVCDGDTIELYVNGLLQNRATECTETKGFIGFQSEGAPIEFRNLYLEPIRK